MSKQKVFNLSEFRKKKNEPGQQPPEQGERPGKARVWDRMKNVPKERKWLILGILVLAAICLMPTPGGLSEKGKYALGLWMFMVICYLTEAIPLPITALLIGSFQVLAGIGSFQEIPHTFMDDAVVFIIGVLMLGSMLVKYNIHKKIALYMLKISGTRIERVVLGIIAFCALSAGFITEHATVTIMLPVGVGIVSLSGGIKKVPRLGKLMMLAISYGVIIGGVATPSGGARNALMLSFLSNLGINVSYGQWMLMAMPFTLIMIPLVTVWLIKLFKPEVTDLKDVMDSIKGEMDADGPMTFKAKMALGIFFAVLIAWVLFSRDFGVGNIAMLGIVLAVILGLVDWNYLQQKTQWGVVILYAGAISMGKMLDTTGAASWLAKQLLLAASAFGVTEDLPLLAITTTIAALTTSTMADGPTVAVLGPIFIKAAELANTSPLAIGVAASLGAAFSYLLVIATPANAIVYGTGFLKGLDFLKAGSMLFILSLLCSIIFLAGLWWHFLSVW